MKRKKEVCLQNTTNRLQILNACQGKGERSERADNVLHAVCHNNYELSVVTFDYVSNISCEDYIPWPLTMDGNEVCTAKHFT